MLFQTLFADLIKAKAGGHKYIRRIPTGNPKRPWQYVYTESAAARGATEGEEVRVRGKSGEDTLARVHKVDDKGLEIEVDGERRRVTHSDWHKLLAEMHGERYLEWAEQRARRVANALYRIVPRELLAELPSGEPARTDALKERAPEVYAKLQDAFKRAGMSSFDAHQALQFSLAQRGWDADARATLIGNMLDGKRRWVAKSYRQVAAAAANLASAHGSRTVQASHVQAAIDLRQPRPQDGERFDATLQVEQAQAQAELGKLQKLLEAARGGSPQDAAAALQAALASPMMAKLAELALAFPGLRNDATVTQSRDALAEVASARPGKPRRDGAETHVFVAGEDGRAVPLPGRYRLVEAEDLIASHKPGTFARNEAYPEGLQERAYHRDKAEQGKVIRNADSLEPSIVVNTNPDAVNGPPVIDSKGIVLGGNSRSMSMILAYDKGKAAADKLRAYLAEHAYEVGLRPEDVKAMRNPVLVREVDTSGQDPKLLVRQLNESFTQAMDPRTMQVALARKLPEETLAQLGSLMGDDETLNTFLGSTRARSLVAQLRTAGIIDRRNENQYTVKGRSDSLNEDGKQLVERVLLGKMVDDPDILSDTPSSLVSSVARAVPYMVQAESAGEGYAVRKDLRTALQAYNSMRRIEGAIPDKASMDRGGDFLQRKIDQGIDSLTDMFEGEHPVKGSPRARAILDVLIRKAGPVQMAKIFRAYARQAKANPEGQASMFGAAKAPADVFRDAVNADEPATEAPAKEQGGLFASLGHALRPRLLALREDVR